MRPPEQHPPPRERPGSSALGNALETPHADEWGDQPTVRYFPEHFLSEVAAMFLVFALLTFLCIILPAGLGVRADPVATPEGSRPQWYFLFLYAYLHYVPPLVGAVTPVVAIIGLALLPFLDSNPHKRPSDRLVAIIGSLVILAVIAGLTIVGLRS